MLKNTIPDTLIALRPYRFTSHSISSSLPVNQPISISVNKIRAKIAIERTQRDI